MDKKLIITKLNNKIISGVYEDMKMTEVNVSEDDSLRLHDVYIGRVENIVKNINCAFVEIQKGIKCYYSIDENQHHIFLNRKNSDKVNIGDLMLVQISRESIKSKLPALTCEINLPGRYVVLVKNTGDVLISNKIKDKTRSTVIKHLLEPLVLDSQDLQYGFIVRTNAENADNEIILEEAERLRDTFVSMMQIAEYRPAFTRIYGSSPSYIDDIRNIRSEELEAVITDDETIYSFAAAFLENEYPDGISRLKLYDDKLLPLAKLYNVESSIKSALSKRVWLKSGGYLVIEPTEALTVIDVNTGKFSGNKKLREDTFLKINLEATEEIGRQMRLRNLSGIIIIDFINMTEPGNRQSLWNHFEGIVRKDTVPVKLVDMTRLDLMELTRKKIRKPIYEMCAGLFSEL